ncbi:MAG TPA: hypothetical protein PLF61_06335, partial [Candidatus Goldiibacteriota bacterium]|nr:hypothetical protein [Candidatus Goldiibacteriota bacterium]
MNKKKVLLYFLFCIFWVRVNLHAYNPVFLRISPFARPVGMAEAFTSISTGTYGLYYNPAGMASVFNHEIQGSYSLWMQKVNSGNVSGIFTEPLFGKVKIGGSYSYSEISRDDGQNYSPVDWSTYDDGVQKITNNKFNFGAAIELFDLLSIGLCYKYNLSGVGNEKFNNSTLDMGIIANFFMRDQILKLGFLASGTGNKLITNDVDFFLPPNYLIGISDEILMNWTNFMISADVTFTPDLIALF